MECRTEATGYVCVLSRGEEAVGALAEFARERRIEGAWFRGIGAASRAVIGYYDVQQKRYVFTELNGPLEIASFAGSISQREGAPHIHAHTVLGRPDTSAHAGHVKEVHVGGTLELFVTELLPLSRTPDAETGLSVIDLTGDAPGGSVAA